MPATLARDAAALQRLTRRDMLRALLEAKTESDRRNYPAKSAILRRLLRSQPDEFRIDSEKDGIVGLTHLPLSFRIHLPGSQLPGEIQLGRLPATSNKSASYDSAWPVTQELFTLLDEAGDRVIFLKAAVQQLPLYDDYPTPFYYDLDADTLVRVGEPVPEKLAEAWRGTLAKLANYVEAETLPEPYTRSWAQIKRGFSPTLRGLSDAFSATEGPANTWYGGPRPLASMLLGGLAGAGLGYLGGSALENVAGGRLQKGRLRSTLALLGGLGGTLPGGVGLWHNVAEQGASGVVARWPDSPPSGGGPSPAAQNSYYSRWDPDPKTAASHLEQLLPSCRLESWMKTAFRKVALAGGGIDDGVMPPIDVDSFGRVVWSPADPFTPPGLRAAAVGLVDGASMLRGGRPTVTVGDVTRMAVGMGSGYLAGNLVGKTFGVLAGLDPAAQERLQQAGTWAGMLKTVVPLAFGR